MREVIVLPLSGVLGLVVSDEANPKVYAFRWNQLHAFKRTLNSLQANSIQVVLAGNTHLFVAITKLLQLEGYSYRVLRIQDKDKVTRLQYALYDFFKSEASDGNLLFGFMEANSCGVLETKTRKVLKLIQKLKSFGKVDDEPKNYGLVNVLRVVAKTNEKLVQASSSLRIVGLSVYPFFIQLPSVNDVLYVLLDRYWQVYLENYPYRDNVFFLQSEAIAEFSKYKAISYDDFASITYDQALKVFSKNLRNYYLFRNIRKLPGKKFRNFFDIVNYVNGLYASLPEKDKVALARQFVDELKTISNFSKIEGLQIPTESIEYQTLETLANDFKTSYGLMNSQLQKLETFKNYDKTFERLVKDLRHLLDTYTIALLYVTIGLNPLAKTFRDSENLVKYLQASDGLAKALYRQLMRHTSRLKQAFGEEKVLSKFFDFYNSITRKLLLEVREQ